MLFDFHKHFCIFPEMKIAKVTCNEKGVDISTFDSNVVCIPKHLIYDTITHEELQKFIAKASAIVYGKFADEETPNYDIINSFIELAQMFDQMIMLK